MKKDLPYSAEYTRPPKFLDHVPQVSSSKIYMTTLFKDRLIAVLTICLLHCMK